MSMYVQLNRNIPGPEPMSQRDKPFPDLWDRFGSGHIPKIYGGVTRVLELIVLKKLLGSNY